MPNLPGYSYSGADRPVIPAQTVHVFRPKSPTRLKWLSPDQGNPLTLPALGWGKVAEHLLATPSGEGAVSAVTVYEMAVGIAKSAQPARRRPQFNELLDAVDVLPFDHGAASEAARVRAALEKAGRPIGSSDTFVARTTLAHRGTLVTHNIREFQRVSNLAVVDWSD